MRYIASIVLLIIMWSVSFGQPSLVLTSRVNTVFIGINNYLYLASDKLPCKKIILETDNGNIEQGDIACQYLIRPKAEGATTVYIKQGNKVLNTYKFRASYIPDPIGKVAGISTGVVKKSILLPQVGVIAYSNMSCGPFAVTSFSVLLSRNGAPVFYRDCKGAKFDEETLNMFKTVQNGDNLVFYHIVATGPDKKERHISAVDLTIEE